MSKQPMLLRDYQTPWASVPAGTILERGWAQYVGREAGWTIYGERQITHEQVLEHPDWFAMVDVCAHCGLGVNDTGKMFFTIKWCGCRPLPYPVREGGFSILNSGEIEPYDFPRITGRWATKAEAQIVAGKIRGLVSSCEKMFNNKAKAKR